MTLFLDVPKSGKFLITVKNVASGRCLVDMLYPFVHDVQMSCTDVIYLYLREASACLLVLL